jgi:hypothetical protein
LPPMNEITTIMILVVSSRTIARSESYCTPLLAAGRRIA